MADRAAAKKKVTRSSAHVRRHFVTVLSLLGCVATSLQMGLADRQPSKEQ